MKKFTIPISLKEFIQEHEDKLMEFKLYWETKYPDKYLHRIVWESELVDFLEKK